jgi:hypothetical protein
MSSASRGLPALLALFAAACASSGTKGTTTLSPGAQPPPTVTQSGTGTDIRLPASNEPVALSVAATPTDAFNALVLVFEGAGIPVKERDMDAGVLGNPRFVTSGHFLGHPMSYFLSCGQGPTGTHANTDRIEMDIRAAVVAAGAGKARLNILVNAIARNMEGTSNTRIQCASTQRLEAELLDRVRRQLAGATDQWLHVNARGDPAARLPW